MRRSIPILLVLVVAALAPGPARTEAESPTAAALDAKYGFRDLRFGRDWSTIEGLEEIPFPAYFPGDGTWLSAWFPWDGHWMCGHVDARGLLLRAARRPDDRLMMFDTRLESITYYFLDDLLYAVRIITAPDGDAVPLGICRALHHPLTSKQADRCRVAGAHAAVYAQVRNRAGREFDETQQRYVGTVWQVDFRERNYLSSACQELVLSEFGPDPLLEP